MNKQIEEEISIHKKSKLNRFANFDQASITNRYSWPSQGVVYIGHLPHGFYQQQLKSYFSQYGEVFDVKVCRSRHTARSKGYGFIQFKYAEVARIVANTMNGYLLMGKMLIANTLPSVSRNPFSYPSSHKYKFINWKRMFRQQKNKVKNTDEIAKEVSSLINKQKIKKQKIQSLSINYQYPGYISYL